MNQPGRAVVLSPGQQAASIPALASSAAAAVSWSPEADYYLELLGSLVKIERELASFPAELRTTSALLPYLPAGAVVYGTVPNPGITIGRALALAEEQGAQNATFGAWLNSETGRLLRQMADRVQSVTPLLGDEIRLLCQHPGGRALCRWCWPGCSPGGGRSWRAPWKGFSPKRASLPHRIRFPTTLWSFRTRRRTWRGPSLTWGRAPAHRLRQPSGSATGAAWAGLSGFDAPPLVAMRSNDEPIELAGMIGVKYLFLEQRAPAGGRKRTRSRSRSKGCEREWGRGWLTPAPAAPAEYLPADALLAGYVSTREPLQLFEEFTAQITRAEPGFDRGLASMDEKLGAGFIQNLTAALGTEAALAVTGLSVGGPAWVMAAVAESNPLVIDSSLQKLVETFNAELGPDEQGKRIVIEQETAGGRTWSTIKPGGLPLGIIWTYDRGYMVAASDRGVAERAIATRNGGFALVWSPEFLAQLPSSAGLHPSAFAWLNAKGALGILSALAPSPALRELVAGRDPILVVFDGTPEQIHAASLYSYHWLDYGRDADREPGPFDRGTAIRCRPQPVTAGPENLWIPHRSSNSRT